MHRRVELPKGAAVLKAPGPAEVRSSNLDARRAITVAQNVIEDEFALVVTTGTVAPAHYGEFVDSARKVDDSFLASTRVKLQWGRARHRRDSRRRIAMRQGKPGGYVASLLSA